MNLYIKFFVLVLKRLLVKKRQSLYDVCKTSFRVSVFDLDLNFHMNNGKFFSVMDLGRFDLLMKTGHFFRLLRNGYYPVVLSESMVFKKSLNWLNGYQIHTQIDSWDERFFYLTQKFMIGDSIVASANVRACFKKRGRKGIVKPQEIFEFGGEEYRPSELSEIAKRQVSLDEALLPKK